MQTTTKNNRGQWLRQLLAEALAGSLNVLPTFVVGNVPSPDLQPAAYLEITSEGLGSADYEGGTLRHGTTEFTVLIWYRAATNDGKTAGLADGRDAVVHKLETALYELEQDEAIANTDSTFAHSVRSIELGSVSGILDDEGKQGMVVATLTVHWTRKAV